MSKIKTKTQHLTHLNPTTPPTKLTTPSNEYTKKLSNDKRNKTKLPINTTHTPTTKAILDNPPKRLTIQQNTPSKPFSKNPSKCTSTFNKPTPQTTKCRAPVPNAKNPKYKHRYKIQIHKNQTKESKN